jgi:ArsR family transcriptional regulator, arsenate/arsenite/antimonite-responsive transcriptional repressor
MLIDYAKESGLLKALGHPVRLKIVSGLLNHECNVNKIVRALHLPQSTVSQHLGVLRARGIVEIRKEGLKSCYKVTDAKIAQLIKILIK